MKVQALSIKRRPTASELEVVALVGMDYYTFKIEVEESKVGEQNLQVASGGRYLWDTLQHNPGAVSKICKMALNVYNGEEVQLPVTITEHLPISPVFAGLYREPAFAD